MRRAVWRIIRRVAASTVVVILFVTGIAATYQSLKLISISCIPSWPTLVLVPIGTAIAVLQGFEMKKIKRVWTVSRITGFFTVLIVLFSLLVWWEQKSGGTCYEQHISTTDNYLCRSIDSQSLPTDYLVIIGIGGVFVAIVTLKSIHHQAVQVRKQTRIFKESADTAEKAANAAFLNAQAVINSERPWLLLQREGIQRPFLQPVEEMPKQMSHCVLVIRNYGRTPAKNYIEKSEMRLGDSVAAPPPSTIYEENLSGDNATFVFPPGETLPAEAILTPESMIRQADRDAIMSGGKFLWLCGRIKYRDTFDGGKTSEHETRFCLRWETRLNSPELFWVMAGPKEYNGAT